MDLLHTIDPQRICFLKHHSKDDVLAEIIDCAAQAGLPCDCNELRERIYYREQLMSTGIGLGIGLPHVRIEGVSEPTITIGLQPESIVGYESIDGLPVKIVIMIIVGKNQHKQHLELLASIVAILKRSGVIDSLLAAKTPEVVYQILKKEIDHV